LDTKALLAVKFDAVIVLAPPVIVAYLVSNCAFKALVGTMVAFDGIVSIVVATLVGLPAKAAH
jgi:hypothetical protein